MIGETARCTSWRMRVEQTPCFIGVSQRTLFAKPRAMRITPRLVQIASLLVAAGYGVACGSSSDSSSFPSGGGNDGGTDAGNDAQVACGGCGCGDEDSGPPNVNITAAQACALLASDTERADSGILNAAACSTYCGASTASCEVPSSFVADYTTL